MNGRSPQIFSSPFTCSTLFTVDSGAPSRSVPLALAPRTVDARDSAELPTVIGALRERAESQVSVQRRDLTWVGVWKTCLRNRCHLGGGGRAKLGSSLSQTRAHAGERALTPRPTGCPDPQGMNTLLST